MPRRPLNPDLVVAEAAAIADAEGLDALTLSAVAARLGVAVPSLYKHVDGMAALRRHLAVRAVERLGDALTNAAVGRSGGDALRALAHAYRRFAHEHPGQYAASLRAPAAADAEHRTSSDQVLRTVLAVLGGYGLTGDDAIDAARALRAALHGFVTLEDAGGFGLPREVDASFLRLIDILDAAWSGSADDPPQGSPDVSR